ncbi:hypothetical protein [Alteribacillus sp. HJP-4]|uniref:hypothetical protein n=1 Tax=Alteribacillus sp. HJP-4 TaxID=2775394 RepID=UPI0035CD2BD7
MWIYLEDIEGELHPKWVVLQAKLPTDGPVSFYTNNQPFERFNPEDFHDDIHSMSIDMSELLQDPFDDYSFGINIELAAMRLEKGDINPALLEDVEYFILLVDDLQKVMNVRLQNFLNQTN